MRLLITTPDFSPRIGGVEEISRMQAEELTRLGHEVTLVTLVEAPAGYDKQFPFKVLRAPQAEIFLSEWRKCDAVIQHTSLLVVRFRHLLMQQLLCRKPWLIVHHDIFNSGPSVRKSWSAKQLIVFALMNRFAVQATVSKWLAGALEIPEAVVIPNAYNSQLFRRLPEVERARDFIFVGRLLPHKGADLLLLAMAELGRRGLPCSATIVGDGPAFESLQELSAKLSLAEKIDFVGFQSSEELVGLLNRHKILIAPSRTAEGLGLVCLEAIACGCAVIGAAEGGLAEAIGPCGILFSAEAGGSLADQMQSLLVNDRVIEELQAHAQRHLVQHDRLVMGQRYADLLERMIGGRL